MSTPAGDSGSYLQSVHVLGIKRTSRSTITVTIGNDSRTFMDGETVIFPNNAGAKRRPDCRSRRVHGVRPRLAGCAVTSTWATKI